MSVAQTGGRSIQRQRRQYSYSSSGASRATKATTVTESGLNLPAARPGLSIIQNERHLQRQLVRDDLPLLDVYRLIVDPDAPHVLERLVGARDSLVQCIVETLELMAIISDTLATDMMILLIPVAHVSHARRISLRRVEVACNEYAVRESWGCAAGPASAGRDPPSSADRTGPRRNRSAGAVPASVARRIGIPTARSNGNWTACSRIHQSRAVVLSALFRLCRLLYGLLCGLLHGRFGRRLPRRRLCHLRQCSPALWRRARNLLHGSFRCPPYRSDRAPHRFLDGLDDVIRRLPDLLLDRALRSLFLGLRLWRISAA